MKMFIVTKIRFLHVSEIVWFAATVSWVAEAADGNNVFHDATLCTLHQT